MNTLKVHVGEITSDDLLSAMLDRVDEERKNGITKFHRDFEDLMAIAQGSASKHQAWEGGYLDHIMNCIELSGKLDHTYDSAAIVLYFHDIEKIFKYSTGEVIDKENWFLERLPKAYGIKFTKEELNALKYVHGEGNDYCKERVMNELAGICHAVDTLSARTYHAWPKPKECTIELPGCDVTGYLTNRLFRTNIAEIVFGAFKVKVDCFRPEDRHLFTSFRLNVYKNDVLIEEVVSEAYHLDPVDIEDLVEKYNG